MIYHVRDGVWGAGSIIEARWKKLVTNLAAVAGSIYGKSIFSCKHAHYVCAYVYMCVCQRERERRGSGDKLMINPQFLNFMTV